MEAQGRPGLYVKPLSATQLPYYLISLLHLLFWMSSDIYSHKSEIDPTQWKPKLAHRGVSEAFRYLSLFYQNPNNDSHVKLDDSCTLTHAGRRLSMTSSSTAATTPSLGSTPTTTSSSFDIINTRASKSTLLGELESSLNSGYSKWN